MTTGKERERLILQEMRITGVDRDTAKFMPAQELGDIEGNLVYIENDTPNDLYVFLTLEKALALALSTTFPFPNQCTHHIVFKHLGYFDIAPDRRIIFPVPLALNELPALKAVVAKLRLRL